MISFKSVPWKWVGTLADPEQIILDAAWVQANIATVKLPGMAKPVRLHKDAAEHFARWMQACLDNGVYGNLGPFGGAFVPRFVRQTGTPAQRLAKCQVLAANHRSDRLSNHSLGLAMDWGAEAYPRGMKLKPGDPRHQLIELAEVFDIENGYRYPLPDSMHFQYLPK